jgi:hypothetical protein
MLNAGFVSVSARKLEDLSFTGVHLLSRREISKNKLMSVEDQMLQDSEEKLVYEFTS